MATQLKTAAELAAEAAGIAPKPAPVSAPPAAAPTGALKTASQLAMEVPPPPVSAANVVPGGQITLREFAGGGAPRNMYGLYDPAGAANVRAVTGNPEIQAFRQAYSPGQYGGSAGSSFRPSVLAPGDIPAGAGQVAGEAAEAGGMGARISRALAPIGEALAPVGKALAPVGEALAPVGRALAPLAPVARGLGTAAAYAAPLLNMYENYQNFSDPNRVRDFNKSLEDKSVLGRAWAGLTNPMTAISGASLAAQEAMGFDPTGQLAKQAEAKRAAEAAPGVAPALADARRRAAQTGDQGDVARAGQIQDFQTRRAAQTGFSEDYRRAGMQPAIPAAPKPAAPAAAKPAPAKPAPAAPVKPAGYQAPTAEEMARFKKETGTAFSSQSINDKLSLERMRAGEETFDTKQANAYRKANPNYRPGQYTKGYNPNAAPKPTSIEQFRQRDSELRGLAQQREGAPAPSRTPSLEQRGMAKTVSSYDPMMANPVSRNSQQQPSQEQRDAANRAAYYARRRRA